MTMYICAIQYKSNREKDDLEGNTNTALGDVQLRIFNFDNLVALVLNAVKCVKENYFVQ